MQMDPATLDKVSTHKAANRRAHRHSAQGLTADLRLRVLCYVATRSRLASREARIAVAAAGEITDRTGC